MSWTSGQPSLSLSLFICKTKSRGWQKHKRLFDIVRGSAGPSCHRSSVNCCLLSLPRFIVRNSFAVEPYGGGKGCDAGRQAEEGSRRETEERGVNRSETGHLFQSSEGRRKGHSEVETASLLGQAWRQAEPEKSTLGRPGTRDPEASASGPEPPRHPFLFQHQHQCYPHPI